MNRLIQGGWIGSLLSILTATCQADVLPMMGGGQVGMAAAPMKHIDITFDGVNLGAHVDDSIAIPLLRPLPEDETFSSTAPWSMLDEKAYNFQYGWNAGGFITLPLGAGIWIESLDVTPGLESYSRPPADPAWSPIFGTDGSSNRWRWSGSMTHNVYAVLNPTESAYAAEYRVYLGDATTGEPLDGFTSDLVTLHFAADPILLGDFNSDDSLTVADIGVLVDAIDAGSTDDWFDLNQDQTLDTSDVAYWVSELKQTWMGDTNLDGEFNSADLVQVFQAGLYEQDVDATWAEGDWSSDHRFGSADLVLAFQDGGFELGPKPAVAAVPEPVWLPWCGYASVFCLAYRIRQRR